MLHVLLYLAIGGGIALGLALLVRWTDAVAARTIDRHVELALSSKEKIFNDHVDEALDLTRVPAPRRSDENAREIQS